MTPRLLLLAYLLVAVGVVAVERGRIGPIMRGAGRPAAYFFIVSTCMLVLAQSYLPGRELYPYSSWTMYTSRLPSRATWRFDFIRASGRREVIPVAEILPGPDPRALMRHLTDAARSLERAAEDERADREAALDATIDAMVRLDARRNRNDAVRSVEVHRCMISGPPPWSRESFECELFRTIAVVGVEK